MTMTPTMKSADNNVASEGSQGQAAGAIDGGSATDRAQADHRDTMAKESCRVNDDYDGLRVYDDEEQPGHDHHDVLQQRQRQQHQLQVVDDVLNIRPPNLQLVVDMARAHQNSIRDTPGAHHIGPDGSNAMTMSDDESMRTVPGDSGAFHYNGSNNINNRVLQPQLYSNDNLPPNIDIIAEATLVVEEDEEEGGHPEATCKRADAANEDAISANFGDQQQPQATSSADNSDDNVGAGRKELVQAEKLDNLSVYFCGRYFRFEKWHLLLLACIVVVIIAVPVVVTQSKNNGDEYPDDESYPPIEWTRELIESIVSPSVSHSSFLTLPNSPQSQAVDWLSNGGAEVITGPSAESVAWRVVQRYVLAVLYYSTNGPKWDKQYGYLDNEKHECDWGGLMDNGWKSTDCVDFSEERREVNLINLWQNKLEGTIPLELASLNLTVIEFLQNSLEGTVPKEIYTLKDLNYLNLGYNDLTGTVASELGNLNELTYLMLDNNALTGTIPPELGKLTQLNGWLSLEGNKLNGTVPESLAQLTNATWIYLNRNDLHGSLEFVCEALRPKEAPGGAYSDSSGLLSELWADINEVECSCCNCCPFVEKDDDDGG